MQPVANRVRVHEEIAGGRVQCAAGRQVRLDVVSNGDGDAASGPPPYVRRQQSPPSRSVSRSPASSTLPVGQVIGVDRPAAVRPRPLRLQTGERVGSGGHRVPQTRARPAADHRTVAEQRLVSGPGVPAARHQRRDPGPGRARRRQPGHPSVALMDDGCPGSAPAGPAAVLGDPGRQAGVSGYGSWARGALDDTDHRRGLRHRPRDLMRAVSLRRTVELVRIAITRRREDSRRWPPRPERALRDPAAVQPGDRVRALLGLRRRRRNPRRLGRQGRGGGRGRHRPRRGRGSLHPGPPR